MNLTDLNILVQSILRLKDELSVPSEDYSDKQDTFTVCGSGDHEDEVSTDKEELDISFVHSTCYQCNGYYGPSFGDPVCATCHLFLYPVSQPLEIPQSFGPEENNDSDSGNDEPEEIFRLNRFEHSEEFIHRPLLLQFEFSSLRPRLISVETPPSVASAKTTQERANFSSIVSPRENDSNVAIAIPGCSSFPNQPSVGRTPVNQDKLAVQLQRLSVASPIQFDDLNFDLFPPEVLIHTFQYLDEISLWSIGQVCSRWRAILFMYVKPEKWKEFSTNRWPLLTLRNMDQDWYELYTAMIKSACCFKCVQQMAAQELPPNWDNNSWRAHRLRTELRVMRTDPLDGIEAMPLDQACCHWQATLEGPAGSAYEGGLFFLYIQVPVSYPLRPPIVRFLTRIFHPNVSRHGDIGIDSIHQNWSLALTMSKLLISIQSLLTDPFCDVCMEPEICRLYITNRKAFEEQARKWTAKYAMHDMIPH